MKQEYINHFNTIFGEGRYEEMEKEELEQAETLFFKTIENRGYKIKEDIMLLNEYEKLEDNEEKIYFLKKVLGNRMPEKIFLRKIITFSLFIAFVFSLIQFIKFWGNEINIYYTLGFLLLTIILFILFYNRYKLQRRFYTKEENKRRTQESKNILGIIGIFLLIKSLFK
ncbi:hypothetical protein BKN14_00440 [Candidatus Gracilibacteria bacterium HOT-871]|nr:hypothetical protein BKN14_00440 [Candidatus Gracilibacteria bacterium HOT-871]